MIQSTPLVRLRHPKLGGQHSALGSVATALLILQECKYNSSIEENSLSESLAANRIKLFESDVPQSDSHPIQLFIDTTLKSNTLVLETSDGKVLETSDINAIRFLTQLPICRTLCFIGRSPLERAAVRSWLEFCSAIAASNTNDELSMLGLLETHLAKKTYLLGNRLSVADVAMMTTLCRRFGAVDKHQILQLTKFPNNVRRWMEYIGQRHVGGVLSEITAKKAVVAGVTPFPEKGSATEAEGERMNFLRQIVKHDLETGKHKTVVTRFPPEPNGYLHLGHAKSICLNFGLAKEFGGRCHLRYDDTNPVAEEERYIQSIQADVKWLGFDWGEHLYFASDHYDQFYRWAVDLIKQGKAYVDDQTGEEITKNRGDATHPSVESPYRNRSVQENLDWFERMRKGEFKEGERVLRAKIDMNHGNPNFRDPVLYRILHQPHLRAGDKWKIYPLYDFVHGQTDSLEKITHSICSLEFETHRPLYEWFQENLGIHRTRQIEFARLNLSHTVMSKRKLKLLVDEGHVADWDDPRMPTISGMKRRGYPPAAIRDFCERVGVAKRENLIQVDLLEHCVREALHGSAVRRFCVLRPLLVVIENYPEGTVERYDVPNHPVNEDMGKRQIEFSRELLIDQSDFLEVAPPSFHRLTVGGEVRLRYGYWIKCVSVEKDTDGTVVCLRCTYDESTKGGAAPGDGRKVQGTIHWISKPNALKAQFRLYSRLFEAEEPEESGDWRAAINPNSMEVITGLVEPACAGAVPLSGIQFERVGFFVLDPDSKKPGSGDSVLI
eukprot:GHVN01060258.1.p1 GENE.GHVN01060258.1~~GHVN01060258.1.p1  ORF type:complete len:780 (+),score=60.71 GHVN01060258.1:209-2548(+)